MSASRSQRQRVHDLVSGPGLIEKAGKHLHLFDSHVAEFEFTVAF